MMGALEENAESRLALFDFAFRHAPIGMALVDTQGRIVRGNKAFSRMIGISPENLSGVAFADFTHPDDLEADVRLFNEVLARRRDGYTIEKRYIRPDKAPLDVRIHFAAMRDGEGEVVRFITQVEDITQAKDAERQLAERAAQLELALESVRGGFWQLDIPARTFETSDRLAQYIDGPEAARLDLEAYLGKISRLDMAAADLTPLIEGSINQNVAEYRLNTIVGERWMRCDRRLLRDADGRPLKIVGMAIDFTEEHHQIERLKRNSQTDSLTGLLNRRGLEARFPQMSSSSGYAVLAIDLDGFKQVNDSYGHAAGDTVLQEAANRLMSCVRGDDLVSRVGGDEFVVVIAGDRETGVAVANRMVGTMRTPFSLGDSGADADVLVDVRASIGGVWAVVNSELDGMIAHADTFLYRVKASGKDGVGFDRQAFPLRTIHDESAGHHD
ncbi:sensor domain-containing diguanylate cyclase [Rhizobium sp. 9140]|uniref:sensor domain-containing diguanylate cyclase n=1 Tax=Rhizobium sp. 9140 TaxID=1761900 RepID=UPI00079A5509|nr:sensor domain-containing diguanylate cyclase [Rhizobium sp. 9140]CZT36480.1 PAS domain S-box-containing protein/diguanylate cyclase (GGDEF) domain-containing protein [Rhizobium sp. 9140]